MLAVVLRHGFNFSITAASETIILVMLAVLCLALSIRLLRLNTQLARIMKAQQLSARVHFNIYQLFAMASIALIAIRIFT